MMMGEFLDAVDAATGDVGRGFLSLTGVFGGERWDFRLERPTRFHSSSTSFSMSVTAMEMAVF